MDDRLPAGAKVVAIFSFKGQLYERFFSLKLLLNPVLARGEPKSAVPSRICCTGPLLSSLLRARLDIPSDNKSTILGTSRLTQVLIQTHL